MLRRSAAVKKAALARAAGKCEQCGGPGPFDVDHILALALGGRDSVENTRVLCRAQCHRAKTSKRDVPAIARAKRKARRNMRKQAAYDFKAGRAQENDDG